MLPHKVSHETLTKRIILEEMQEVWDSIEPPLDPKRIAKIAVGPKEATDLGNFTT